MMQNTITADDMTNALYGYNPWWQQKPIPRFRLKSFKRRGHAHLAERLMDNSIMCTLGARRVGKTTLLYQIIDMLLHQCSIDPARILFAPMDDPYLYMSQENFEKMLGIYAKRILKREGLDDVFDTYTTNDTSDQRVYVILDEIQGLENWQAIIKRWYDVNRNIKFIITGSSSAGILYGSSESLTGRITYDVLHTMSFAEYLGFKNPDRFAKPLEGIEGCMDKTLQTAADARNARVLYDKLVLVKDAMLPHVNAVKTILDEYLIKGGYPENVHVDNMTVCADVLATYMGLTIYKDIMRISGARDPIALESLLVMIAKGSSSVFNKTAISKTLGISRSTTLSQYLRLLYDTYMVSEAPFYSKSAAKSARKESKMYINDVGMRNVMCMAFDVRSLTDAAEIGKITETVAADHTRRMSDHARLPGSGPRVSYWHDGYEVDMVARLPQHVIPIEVKYRENVTMSDLKGLRRFEKKFKAPFAMAITKDQLGISENTVFVPLWLYLLMC